MARSFRMRSASLILSIIVGPLVFLVTGVSTFTALAQNSELYVRLVRALETDDAGIPAPLGVVFSPQANAFYVIERTSPTGSATTIAKLTPAGDLVVSTEIAATIADPINMAFDTRLNRLLIYDGNTQELLSVAEGADGNLMPATLVRQAAGHFGVQAPQGLTFDPESGALYFLDGSGPRLVRVQPAADGSFATAAITAVALPPAVLSAPRGIAYDPTRGHLHVMDAGRQKLSALTTAGELVASRDFAEFALGQVQGLVFAPSADQTDDPLQLHLYLVNGDSVGRQASGLSSSSQPAVAEERAGFDASRLTHQLFVPLVTDGAPEAEEGERTPVGGQILEFSFTEGPQRMVRAAAYTASLVQTIDASAWSPPSTDSSGIIYLPDSKTLLVADSEVNETVTISDSGGMTDVTFYQGANMFEATITGTLVYTWTTLDYPGLSKPFDEPTGIALNPTNGHLFITDDTQNPRYIYEVDRGPDGDFGTADDVVNEINVTDLGISDPEGATYVEETGHLFIADGLNHEVYELSPGLDGNFGTSDDQVTSFDTFVLGIEDPEGIAYNPDTGNLYLVGKSRTVLYEVSTTGVLVQAIDMSAAFPREPAGLAYAPSSVDPTVMSIYIAARGFDNNTHPFANDGMVYEMTLPLPPVATDDSYSTDEDTPLTIAAPGVLGNDTDVNGDPLTAVLDSGPSNGTLTLNADGSFTYIPDPTFNGADSFTYHANDGLYDSNLATVTITINEPVAPIATCGGFEVFETAPGVFAAPDFAGNLLVGDNGDNWLIGTRGPDLIVGLGGSDDIWGWQGDDILCGGEGIDIILGLDGNDVLYGDDDHDWLIGGNGNDILYGGDGWDDLLGNRGRDTLYGENGFDVLLGGSSADVLFGGDDPDALFGQRGNDDLDGGNSFDYCRGGSGRDTITACEGASSAAVDVNDNTDDIDTDAARRLNDQNGDYTITQRIKQMFLPIITR